MQSVLPLREQPEKITYISQLQAKLPKNYKRFTQYSEDDAKHTINMVTQFRATTDKHKFATDFIMRMQNMRHLKEMLDIMPYVIETKYKTFKKEHYDLLVRTAKEIQDVVFEVLVRWLILIGCFNFIASQHKSSQMINNIESLLIDESKNYYIIHTHYVNMVRKNGTLNTGVVKFNSFNHIKSDVKILFITTAYDVPAHITTASNVYSYTGSFFDNFDNNIFNILRNRIIEYNNTIEIHDIFIEYTYANMKSIICNLQDDNMHKEIIIDAYIKQNDESKSLIKNLITEINELKERLSKYEK